MPDMGVFHPQIVHFVIAFLILGVIARVASLFPLGKRLEFLGPMAAVLILLGALASLAAVRSGHDAHGPVERVPGARAAVVEHEEWGERARNVFLAVALLELLALAAALGGRPGPVKGIRVVAGVVGLAGLFVLYEASEHGGDLVYNYAGGVGIRSGEHADVQRLLVAGLYHQARAAREAGRREEAARLSDELLRQMPDDPNVRFLAVESMIRDRDDPRAALDALPAVETPPDDWRLDLRRGMLTAEAYRALGVPDSATNVIAGLKERFKTNLRASAALERMAGSRGGRR